MSRPSAKQRRRIAARRDVVVRDGDRAAIDSVWSDLLDDLGVATSARLPRIGVGRAVFRCRRCGGMLGEVHERPVIDPDRGYTTVLAWVAGGVLWTDEDREGVPLADRAEIVATCHLNAEHTVTLRTAELRSLADDARRHPQGRDGRGWYIRR